MNGAGHETVVAPAIAVIEMDAEKPAAPCHQRRRERRLLARIEDVGKIERHAEIG